MQWMFSKVLKFLIVLLYKIRLNILKVLFQNGKNKYKCNSKIYKSILRTWIFFMSHLWINGKLSNFKLVNKI